MEKFWIWFKLLKIEYYKKIKMLFRFTPDNIFSLSKNHLKEVDLSESEIYSFYDINVKKIADEVYKYNQKRGIKTINIFDKQYPQLLKQIYEPPLAIYVMGNIELLNKNMISIFVGKKTNKYGRKVVKELSSYLCANNIIIVSRLEKIEASGYIFDNVLQNNLMVLSCGFNNRIYCNNGAILSEYEYFAKANRNTNILRDRIITGLSKQSILVQMTLNDGVSYAVDNIIDQNREVWVLPGNIDCTENAYTNELMKYGVNILTDYSKLLVYEQKNNM